MNKKEYLLKKESIKKKNEQTSVRNCCSKCLRPVKACFCKGLKPFSTRTRFCILMHPLEAKPAQIGTGRLTSLSLKNSEIIIDIGFDKNPRFNVLLSDFSYHPLVLYPDKNSIDLSSLNKNQTESLNKKDLLIFIIDATWPCAKTMMKRTTKLHSLEKISFQSAHISSFDIKHQPASFCLSTIESVYQLIAGLENCGVEKGDPSHKETMLIALKKMVQFHKDCANDPNLNHYVRKRGPLKKPSERKPSKKWETRRICYQNWPSSF